MVFYDHTTRNLNSVVWYCIMHARATVLTIIEHPDIVDLCHGLGVEEVLIRYAQVGQQLKTGVRHIHEQSRA